jgi:hypothetical protein
MSGILLLLVGIVYVAVAIGYFIDGKTGLGIAFIAYAIANYGLYLAGK